MLKQVTIECDVPDGYEALAMRMPDPRFDTWVGVDGRIRTPNDGAAPDGPRLIVRPIEPIPQGVSWLAGPLQINGMRTFNAFISPDGQALQRGEFDYDKWLPRASEFPAYAPPQMIPLGPEDVITNKTIIRTKLGEAVVLSKTPTGIGHGPICDGISAERLFTVTWAQLRREAEYSKYGDGNFAPCSKPATQA